MTHHDHKEEEKNYDIIYYIIGLLTGLFVGIVINNGLILILVLGVVGLLFSGLFLQLLVKGREDK